MSLIKSCAIITGGAGGIGATIARQLAATGQPVVLYDIAEEQARSVIKGIEEKGGEALFVKGDVGSEEDWKTCSKQRSFRFVEEDERQG